MKTDIERATADICTFTFTFYSYHQVHCNYRFTINKMK